MKLRTLTLGTAALAATLSFSSAAFAQQSYYNTNPTPAERADTDRLNADAAARAQDDSNTNQANRQNYDAQRADYDNNRARSDAERAAYARDRARYDAENDGAAHAWGAFYGATNLRDVRDLSASEVRGLRVTNRSGSRIGRVTDVDVTRHGHISRVAIRTVDGVTAWVDTNDLRFEPGTRVVLTTLSREQINDMSRMHYPRF